MLAIDDTAPAAEGVRWQVYARHRPDSRRSVRWHIRIACPRSRTRLRQSRITGSTRRTWRSNEAEPGEADGPRVDVNRVTASVTYHGALRDNGGRPQDGRRLPAAECMAIDGREVIIH